MEQIYLRDYVCHAEIGVFDSEYGHKQRLRFNIFLTLDYGNLNRSDDLKDVLSYEIILDAIEKNLAGKRLNLLESLADNISSTCFEYRQVRIVDIQIEKLDRIKGSLGIRVVRKKD